MIAPQGAIASVFRRRTPRCACIQWMDLAARHVDNGVCCGARRTASAAGPGLLTELARSSYTVLDREPTVEDDVGTPGANGSIEWLGGSGRPAHGGAFTGRRGNGEGMVSNVTGWCAGRGGKMRTPP